MVSKKRVILAVSFVILFVIGISFFVYNFKEDTFSVKTFLLKSNIPLGGESISKVKIENNEDVTMDFNIHFTNLENIVFIDDSEFTLGPNEEKEIEISFKDNNSEVKVYLGELIISNKFDDKKIPIVITVENKEPILSIIHSVIPAYHKVYPGGKLGVDIKLYDLDTLSVPTIKSKSYIQNFQGDILWTNEQDLIVDGSKTEIVDIPKDWSKGNYILVTSVNYKEVESISTYLFTLSDNDYDFLQNFNTKLLILIILIIILGFIIILFCLIKSRDEFWIELKKQQNKELKENLKLIKDSKNQIKKSNQPVSIKKKKIKNLNKSKKKIINKIKKKQATQKKELKHLKRKNKKKEIQNRLKNWKDQGYKMFEAEEEIGKVVNVKSKVDKWKKQGYKVN